MAESDVRVFWCINCNSNFDTKNQLLDHGRNPHKRLKVECEGGNRFSCETALEQHFNQMHSRYIINLFFMFL